MKIEKENVGKILRSLETKNGSLNHLKMKEFEYKYPRVNKTICSKFGANNLKEVKIILKLDLDKKPRCEFCGGEVRVRCGVFTSTCGNKSCKNQHTKKSNLEKYGVDNPAKLESSKEKFKKTCKERFGEEHPAKAQRKRFSENLKKSKEKRIQTCKEKYGVEYPLQSIEVRCKSKETLKKNHGVEYPLQSGDILQQTRQTCKDRYGAKNVFQLPEFQERCFNRKFFHIKNSDKIDLDTFKTFIEEDVFNIDKCMEFYNTSESWVYEKLRTFNLDIKTNRVGKSRFEEEIQDYIKTFYKGKIKRNTRDIIKPKELDFFFEDERFAIEFNGIYWHSNIDKIYHLNKTNLCEEQGIHLFHIFENEWIDPIKRDIWKSKISLKLRDPNINKINARDCSLKEITSKISTEFLNENHLQGSVNSKVSYGLYYKEELVSVMTFGKSRFKRDEFELLRFASKKYTIVRGAFSKLLKFFTINNSNKELISYGNRRWVSSLDNIYGKFFKKENTSKPNYWYWKGDEFIGRISAQKHKLKDLLESFDENLTEKENMFSNGYRILYDCGNIKYKYSK